ncbi:hypothetical protein [Nannocystis punicea]|uniref:Uncharacterized protein n=1 Tax=Nannocystis punicea TaxID=2995304 RepID=A0ABY7GY34_9BACT|nr:hypothetical protein [Nannocystis poenicansa]WAS91774.1 hypothetical protein O0S08_36795 [Nannocystis poenicansa]
MRGIRIAQYGVGWASDARILMFAVGTPIAILGALTRGGRGWAAFTQMVLFGLLGLLIILSGGFTSYLYQLPLLLAYLSLRGWMAVREARAAASLPARIS